MSATFEIRLGTALAYDGSRCVVVEMASDAIVLRDPENRLRRVRMIDLLQQAAPMTEAGQEDMSGDLLATLWADATKEQQAAAREKAEHIREVQTGFKSGNEEIRLAGEPRPEFDPASTRPGDRRRAKASELSVSLKTLHRWEVRFDLGEELSLLDLRGLRAQSPFANLDTRWIDTCRHVIEENVLGSKRSITATLAVVEARLSREYPDGGVKIPGLTAAHQAVHEITRGSGAFKANTKAKRSIANRPLAPYGRLRAVRPGEYVLLDSTPLNVFGIAPITGRWIRVDLTVAMDLYDRSILGLRLAPVSTKSIDVASVLMEALWPQELPSSWGAEAVWPFHGVPANIVVDAETFHPGRFRRPGVVPETIIIDHGKPFMSLHVSSVCRRLGISIQPAHVYTPTDKAPIERFFRTIEELLQELPGYKGSDVSSRGKDVETETVYTLPQLEEIVREWIATIYHRRPHAGLKDLQIPGVVMSPAQKFEQGVTVAGRLRVPNDPNLLIEMLPVVKRKFNHYGVEIGGLRYSGPVVAKYHDRVRSSANGKTSWLFFVNPDDMTKVYFHDADDSTWHTLYWEHASDLQMPFSLDALEYAKQLALNRKDSTDVAATLGALLERWGAGRASTPRERRISARLAAQLAETHRGPDSSFVPQAAREFAEHAATLGLAHELGVDHLPDPSIAEPTDEDDSNQEEQELDDIDLMEDL